MKKKNLLITAILVAATMFNFSCQKEQTQTQAEEKSPASVSQSQNQRTASPPFNLEVVLRGAGKSFGLIKFRQDNTGDKIIYLDTWVRNLEPNHTYRLQRAVDAINVVDGNCTSTNWLTLGKGLTPQAIVTDENGTGTEDLWRSIAMVPSGSIFDIHFRIIDAVSMAVVLTSDCYQYTVR